MNGKRHLVVPYTLTYHDVRYIVVPGYGSPSDFFDLCKRGLEELWQEGAAGYPKMTSIGLHPRWAGQAGRTARLREFLEYAVKKEDVWLTRRLDSARWGLAHHEEFRH